MNADHFKKVLWENFGASIDMLIAAIKLCPDHLWQEQGKFFYISYHTTIFLDYYLSYPVTVFQPLLPYTLVEEHRIPPEAVDDVVPNNFYTKEDLVMYLHRIRKTCRSLILDSTESTFSGRWISPEEIHLHGLCPSIVTEYSVLQIIFYNFRHVQHHVAQLNFILRQRTNSAPEWIALVE